MDIEGQFFARRFRVLLMATPSLNTFPAGSQSIIAENRLVFLWASTSDDGQVGLMCPNLPRVAYLGVARSRSLLDEIGIVELSAHAFE